MPPLYPGLQVWKVGFEVHRGSREANVFLGLLLFSSPPLFLVTMGIVRVTIWAIGVTNLLTKSPWPSKSSSFFWREQD